MTEARRTVCVLSQVPPPVHGSTVMTAVLLTTLSSVGVDPLLVNRRFSRSVAEVGSFSFRKVRVAAGLVARVHQVTRAEPDALWIYFLTNRPFSLASDWLATEVLRRRRSRVVYYLHTLGYSDLGRRSWLVRLLLRRIFSLASEVVLLDALQQNDVAPFLPRSARVSVIPNTRDDVDPTSTSEPREQVLFISNLIRGKGAEHFIDLAHALDAPGVFVLCGSGDEEYVESLRARARRPDGTSVVRFEGAVDDARRDELLHRARALIFPSTYPLEAQPLVLIEAMSRSVPIIATRVGLVEGMIRDGENGLLVDGSLNSTVRTLRRLLADERLWQTLSEGARATYLQTHSKDAYRSAWSALIQRQNIYDDGR